MKVFPRTISRLTFIATVGVDDVPTAWNEDTKNGDVESTDSSAEGIEEQLSPSQIITSFFVVLVLPMLCGVLPILVPLPPVMSNFVPRQGLYLLYMGLLSIYSGPGQIYSATVFLKIHFKLWHHIALNVIYVAPGYILYIGSMLGNKFPIPLSIAGTAAFAYNTVLSFAIYGVCVNWIGITDEKFKDTYIKQWRFVNFFSSLYAISMVFLVGIYYFKNYQSFVLIGFQIIFYGHKAVARYYTLNHCKEVGLNEHQAYDLVVLFTFWVEFVAQLFLVLMFPEIHSVSTVAIYFVVEFVSVYVQLVIDSASVRSQLISATETYITPSLPVAYTTRIIGWLTISSFYQRRTSLMGFMSNIVVRVLTCICYFFYSSVIYFSYNKQYYLSFKGLGQSDFYISQVYAGISLLIVIVQFLLVRPYLEKHYSILLIPSLAGIFKRNRQLMFWLVLAAWCPPFMAILSHNNVVSWFEE